MYFPPYPNTDHYLPPCESVSAINISQHIPPQFTTRKVYFNQNFVPLEKNNRVHINPNFRHKVHVNPNFRKTIPPKSTNIYMNPLFQQQISNPRSSLPSRSVSLMKDIDRSNNLVVNVNVKTEENLTALNTEKAFTTSISIENKLGCVVPAFKAENKSNQNLSSFSKSYSKSYKILTKNKLIRASSSTKETSYNFKNKINHNFYGVTKEINSRTSANKKFVKTTLSSRKEINKTFSFSTKNKFNCTLPLNTSQNYKISLRNKLIPDSSLKNEINSKYKIVHSNGHKPKQFNVISQHKIVRKSLQLAKVGKKHNNSKNKYKLDRRILDSSNSKKLKHKITKKAFLMNLNPSREIIKRTSAERSPLSKKIPKFIKIKDQIYKFNSNYDTLYFVSLNKHKLNKIKPSKIVIHNYTFVLMPTGVYKRQHVNKIKINSRMLKKDNNPCLRYRQRGFCKEYESGTCSKKHDPNQIRMCTRFLQGACLNDKCLLSHKVSPEKMPTCKYFLDGLCHKNNCPYLHVKLSKNAEICKQFLEGFCSRGLECTNRHQFLCPDFEAKGKCLKRLCKYPHKIIERSSAGKSLKKINQKLKARIEKEHFEQSKNQEKNKPAAPQDTKDDNTSDLLRYYETKQELIELISDKQTVLLSERPKVGDLPSFIAIE